MRLKVVQLNIYRGKWFDKVVDFLKGEKPDIICLEEVTTNKLNHYKDKNISLFAELKMRLDMEGVYDCVVQYKNLPGSSFGNAVFSKFKIRTSKVVAMKDGGEFDYDFERESDFIRDRPFVPRHLLDTTLEVEGLNMHAICVHGAWTVPPADNEETLRQAEIIAQHLQSLGNTPFIMGGDMNMPKETKVIEKISKFGNNLMSGSGISQTLNPRLHYLKDTELAVDYIFASSHFELKSIKVPQVDISDHLPVVAELEFNN